MENKKPNWILKGVSIGTLLYSSYSYVEHDCEIEKVFNNVETVNLQAAAHDLTCDHKSLVIGLTNTVSGDQVACFLNDVING